MIASLLRFAALSERLARGLALAGLVAARCGRGLLGVRGSRLGGSAARRLGGSAAGGGRRAAGRRKR